MLKTHRCLNAKDSLRHWRVAPAQCETHVRRLKPFQQSAARPWKHSQTLRSSRRSSGSTTLRRTAPPSKMTPPRAQTLGPNR
eukprot:3582227-Pyramimonas_sp.AAC.1